ncbi:DUF5723 family protein [Algivirga pacifica]|uniref:DUF5723 domain-containing protein n=1 Tax=Algivirga pacifica TaxID=1162670 RepID=A0ABP9D7J6_9BACT
MKTKILRLLLVLLSIYPYTTLRAQIDTDISSRYIGVRGMRYQPANIADTPFQWDINAGGANIATLSDQFLPDFDFIGNLKSGGIDNIQDAFVVGRSGAILTGNIYLPSVSYSINDHSAVYLVNEFRSYGIYDITDADLYNIVRGDFEGVQETIANGDAFSGYLNIWLEIGAGYAHSFTLGNGDRLKLGGKIKLLSGTASAFFDIDNISLNTTEDGEVANVEAVLSLGLDGNINKIFEDESIDLLNSAGVGFDLGAVYEYYPEDDAENYRWRIGLTVNDLGRVNYSDSEQLESIKVSRDTLNTRPFRDAESIGDFSDALTDNFGVEPEANSKYNIRLPTTVSLQFDYYFGKNWYLHFNPAVTFPDFDLLVQNINEVYSFDITPRYETLRWGVYMPFNINTYSERLDAGIGARWRFISVGSNSLISNLFNPDSPYSNLFFNVRIPLYKERYKRNRDQ